MIDVPDPHRPGGELDASIPEGHTAACEMAAEAFDSSCDTIDPERECWGDLPEALDD
jgi:hypothetical protein